MPTEHHSPAARAALAELAGLAHTDCDPDMRRALVTALSVEGPPAVDGRSKGERAEAALLRVVRSLPAPEELLRDPHRLADVQAWAAVTNPAVYMALVNHYVLCLGSITAFGHDDHALGPYREALRDGQAKGVFLVTETAGAGSHLAPGTTAEYDHGTGEFVLTTPTPEASKFSSVRPGGPRTVAVVCARTLVGGVDHGVFPFLVDLTDDGGPCPGVEVSGPVELGALPLDYALVRFRGARVPHGQWLSDTARIDRSGRLSDPCGTPAARLRRTMSVGQALWGTVPAAMAAVARECAVSALRFGANRRIAGHPAPGTPLLRLRTHQHALIGALSEAFALACAAGTALETLHGTTDPTSTPPPARAGGVPSTATDLGTAPWVAVDRSLALLKAISTESAARVAGSCQRHCGLAGFLGPNRIHDWRGAADAFTVAGGDNHLVFLDAGREAVTSTEPIDPPGSDLHGVSLTDDAEALDWWPHIAHRYQQALARDVRRRLDSRDAAGATALDLWNPLLPRTRELGEAVASAMLARCVVRTVSGVRSGRLRQALRPLTALFGVLQAQRVAGPLVATRTLSPSALRALPEAAGRLCAEVEPHLPLLLDGLSETAVPGCATPMHAEDYAAALWSAAHREPAAGRAGRRADVPRVVPERGDA